MAEIDPKHEVNGVSTGDCVRLIDATPIPMILVGANDKILTANRHAITLCGAGLVSRHYIAALRQPALLDCIEAVQSGRSEMSEAVYLANEARREATYTVHAAPVDLDAGRATLVTFVDATDMQQAGQIRRDFVANVSHELRTPLTALLGFIETLRGAARDDAAARERFLGIMEREAERMNRLVRDLLSLSRVESQQRVRPTLSVDLAAIVRSTALSLRPLAEEAGLTLEVTGAEAAAEIPGDPDQLAQVMSNLLENAIKYGGDGGRVSVVLTRPDHAAAVRGPAVSVAVADEGEGFDPVHIPRLTERFYRVDSHRSRELGGTGLGLAIVRHIVERHRGRLQIESTPGAGSRFTVVLPVA